MSFTFGSCLGSFRFVLNPNSLLFGSARAECQALGAGVDLFPIEEDTFPLLQEFHQANGLGEAFIGLRGGPSTDPSQYLNLDGSSNDFSGNDSILQGQFPWAANEPNVLGTGVVMTGQQLLASRISFLVARPSICIEPCSTSSPTRSPTDNPTSSFPTNSPTTPFPTANPTVAPTDSPTTSFPTNSPTIPFPTANPTVAPTDNPTTSFPTNSPTTSFPTANPTAAPTDSPTTSFPTNSPTTGQPSFSPTTGTPTGNPTQQPSTSKPTGDPTRSPTNFPTISPIKFPTESPTKSPTESPTNFPTLSPTNLPTSSPSAAPTSRPSVSPTSNPTLELPLPQDNQGNGAGGIVLGAIAVIFIMGLLLLAVVVGRKRSSNRRIENSLENLKLDEEKRRIVSTNKKSIDNNYAYASQSRDINRKKPVHSAIPEINVSPLDSLYKKKKDFGIPSLLKSHHASAKSPPVARESTTDKDLTVLSSFMTKLPGNNDSHMNGREGNSTDDVALLDSFMTNTPKTQSRQATSADDIAVLDSFMTNKGKNTKKTRKVDSSDDLAVLDSFMTNPSKAKQKERTLPRDANSTDDIAILDSFMTKQQSTANPNNTSKDFTTLGTFTTNSNPKQNRGVFQKKKGSQHRSVSVNSEYKNGMKNKSFHSVLASNKKLSRPGLPSVIEPVERNGEDNDVALLDSIVASHTPKRRSPNSTNAARIDNLGLSKAQKAKVDTDVAMLDSIVASHSPSTSNNKTFAPIPVVARPTSAYLNGATTENNGHQSIFAPSAEYLQNATKKKAQRSRGKQKNFPATSEEYSAEKENDLDDFI